MNLLPEFVKAVDDVIQESLDKLEEVKVVLLDLKNKNLNEEAFSMREAYTKVLQGSVLIAGNIMAALIIVGDESQPARKEILSGEYVHKKQS